MNLQTYTDAGEYLQYTQPFLEAQEAANGLILGVTIRLRDMPEWTEVPPYLGTAYLGTVTGENDQLLLAAAMTPPFSLLAAAPPDVPQAALDLLVRSLTADGWSVPGVNAENRLAGRIAQSWSAVTGQSAAVKMRERIYELRQVIPPPNPPSGFLRPATMDDIDMVTAWRNAFTQESMHEAPSPGSRAASERGIRNRSIFLWEDHRPVSMAARTRSTPHGEAVGLVYTPPELRGRGFASACVAALSQQILDSGKSFCTLFTDLDYPTSNSIYQKIGYQPVCDFLSFGFA